MEEDAPGVAHVFRLEEEFLIMRDVDMPSPAYYEALNADMAKRHPRADPFVLEHLAVTEPVLGACITSGFPLGAPKSTGRICQPNRQFLGDLAVRDGLESVDEHILKCAPGWTSRTRRACGCC